MDWHEATYSSFTSVREHKLQQLQIPLHNLAVCIADIWWEIIHKFGREGGWQKQLFLPVITGTNLQPCWLHVHLIVITVIAVRPCPDLHVSLKKKKTSPYEGSGAQEIYASFSLWVLTPTKPSISFSPAALPTQVKFQIPKDKDVSRLDAFL